MEAFHSFWSEPNRGRNNGNVRFPDYEQLTAMLSAFAWQQNHGPIRMITDSEGADYFAVSGLLNIWDRVDVFLDDLKGNVDPFLFWAAGKLYALKMMPVPCVMLDTDLIIWEKVDFIENYDVVAAHSEALNEDVYPDKSIFHLKKDYAFPKDWDFTLDAANTAFLYLKDAAFRDYYVDAATRFFNSVELEGLNPVTAMCFAEQRVLPMCAKAKEQKLSYLFDLEDADEQEIATHTWGFKQILDEVPQARYEFCMRCVRRIALQFPEKLSMLEGCRDLRDYYHEYMKNVTVQA